MESSASTSVPLLVATNQQSRLTACGLMLMGGVFFPSAVKSLLPETQVGEVLSDAVGALGSLTAVCGALLALYSIKCPNCGLKWVWWSISKQHFTRWLPWLHEFDHCPKCSHSVSSKQGVLQSNISLQRDRDG